MPHLTISQEGLDDLARLREFLLAKNRAAADKATKTLVSAFRRIKENPQIGRPVEALEDLGYRELSVLFGKSGYKIFYHFIDEEIKVHAVRHMREEGYN